MRTRTRTGFSGNAHAARTSGNKIAKGVVKVTTVIHQNNITQINHGFENEGYLQDVAIFRSPQAVECIISAIGNPKRTAINKLCLCVEWSVSNLFTNKEVMTYHGIVLFPGVVKEIDGFRFSNPINFPGQVLQIFQ